MQPMKTDDFLEHYGVKGMKWGVRRQENRVARAETNKAVRDVKAKGYDTTDAGIKNARRAVPDAQRRVADAKDQYKVNKHTMNTIEAKRPLKVAVADLRRILKNSEMLTKDEQLAYDMLQTGRAVIDVFSLPGRERSEFQKIVDSAYDKQQIREQTKL